MAMIQFNGDMKVMKGHVSHTTFYYCHCHCDFNLNFNFNVQVTKERELNKMAGNTISVDVIGPMIGVLAASVLI